MKKSKKLEKFLKQGTENNWTKKFLEDMTYGVNYRIGENLVEIEDPLSVEQLISLHNLQDGHHYTEIDNMTVEQIIEKYKPILTEEQLKQLNEK